MSKKKGLEEEFTKNLKKELESHISGSGYDVTSHESLIYQFFVNAEGQLEPKTPLLEPKRGQLAFQTDLLVKKTLRLITGEGIPLVVIEVKFGEFTTHDILTYSAKATKHKEIYPYLRYGLVVGEAKKIDKRFFTHNSGFDFALAIEKTEPLSEVTKIVKQQLEAAERMLKVFQGKEVKRYITNTELTFVS